MGPVERDLRRALGTGVSAPEARRRFGLLGSAILDRYLRRGIVEARDGLMRLRVRQLSPAELAAIEARRLRREEIGRAIGEERAAKERREAERERLRRQIASATSPEAALRIAREGRTLAFASRALARLDETKLHQPGLAGLFGIEFDNDHHGGT